MNCLKHRLLVLGLGQLLMSDDGLGIHAAEALKQRPWPPGVAILEVGSAVLNYLEEISLARRVIAIDAVEAGGAPGSLYRLEYGDLLPPPESLRDAHGISLAGVINLAREMTGFPTGIIIYGIQPQYTGPGNRLSPAVEAALPRLISSIAGEILQIAPEP